MHTNLRSHVENRVYKENGRVMYAGRPWKELSVTERTALIEQCFAHGVTSDAQIARLLNVRGANGDYSRSAVGGHIHRNRSQFKTQRKRNRTATRGSGGWRGLKVAKPATKPRQPATETPKLISVVAEAKTETPTETISPEKPKLVGGFCVKLVRFRGGDDHEYCGEPTGGNKIPMCPKHRT